ncbi:MAG: MATE family efflux transporter [Bacteroidales bacterium]|nr:MATE family efflux transporter [Bacteroidales bacterium]
MRITSGMTANNPSGLTREILRLTLPNIISNITVPLIGMVDVALMGHLNDSIFLAAVALANVLFNLLFMSFSFLRMSTTGYTAQAYGARNHQEIAVVLQRALLVALSIAGLLLVLQSPLAKIGFGVLEGEAATKHLARTYYNIRIWSAPASLTTYVMMGWFVGMQNTRYPMFISIVVNLLNITFSVFFVRVLQMDVQGVALGTVLAEYMGLLLAFLLFKNKYKKLFVRIPISILLQKEKLVSFFAINANLFIRSLILIGSLSLFTSRAASLGNETLAVNSILMQYFFVFSYFLDGFAYAAEALTGKYAGSKNTQLFILTVRYIFRWGWGLSCMFSIAIFFGFKSMTNLLTNNEDLLILAIDYRYWMAAVPIASFAAFLWDGIFVGTLSAKYMRKAMVIAGLFIFLPAVYLLKPVLANHGLWIAFLLFMSGRSVAMWIYSAKLYKSNGIGYQKNMQQAI